MNDTDTRAQAHSLFQAQHLPEARDLFLRLCERNPNDFESWCFLGIIHGLLSELDDGERCLRRAVALRSDDARARYNLARLLSERGDHASATEEYQRCVQLAPDLFEARFNLGESLRQQGRLTEALQTFRDLRPHDETRVMRAMAGIYMHMGKPHAAVAACRQVLDANPAHAEAHSFALFLSLLTTPNLEQLYREHGAWPKRHRPAPIPRERTRTAWRADRPLRIGYLSPHFYRHSVAYFIEPLLAGHDRMRFEVLVYADVAHPDAVTARLQNHVHGWRFIHGQPDTAVAAQIEADGIDILVDLAGHIAGHRMPLLAQRAAPIQVHYIGYLGTTGLDTLDYRLADHWTDPEGEADTWSSERIARLPRGYLCFKPLDSAPEVAPPPILTRGFATFGSFNHLCKTSDATFDLWTRVLHAAPEAHLVMKNESFLDSVLREQWSARFEQAGIASERVHLYGITKSSEEHLDFYRHIDIALDTLPYNGTTTTCEALWMGVPVLTLPGRTHCGRQGLSLLSQAGLTELIATDEADYLRRAVALAHDPERLRRLRRELRPSMRVSDLCDQRALVEDVEVAYRAMWVDYCGKTGP